MFLLTGTRSISGASDLIERKGADTLSEFGLKLRLHQTVEPLKRGVNLPSGVRKMARDSGKQFESVRRSSVGLPLLFFVLTGERLRWSLPVSHRIGLEDEVVELFERYRKLLRNAPERCETSLFDELEAFFLEEEQPEEKEEKADDRSLSHVIEATLYQESIDLESGSGLAVAGDSRSNASSSTSKKQDTDASASATAGEEEAKSEALSTDGGGDSEDEEATEEESKEEITEKRSWWPWTSLWMLALIATVTASWVGFTLTADHQPMAEIILERDLQFPFSDFESGHEVYLASALDELEDFLISSEQPEALTLVPEVQELRGFADSEALLEWLGSAANEGNREATRLLGLIKWRRGSSSGEIREHFAAAAALGDSEAGYLLALHSFCEGSTQASSDEVVMKRLTASAETGNASSCELLATWLIDSDPLEAFQFLVKASRGERPSATYQLGLRYANETGTKKSPEAAAGAFRSAAERGCLKAMVAWGRCLESGFGTAADFTEAGRWMKMAALHQNEAAQTWLQQRELVLAEVNVAE